MLPDAVMVVAGAICSFMPCYCLRRCNGYDSTADLYMIRAVISSLLNVWLNNQLYTIDFSGWLIGAWVLGIPQLACIVGILLKYYWDKAYIVTACLEIPMCIVKLGIIRLVHWFLFVSELQLNRLQHRSMSLGQSWVEYWQFNKWILYHGMKCTSFTLLCSLLISLACDRRFSAFRLRFQAACLSTPLSVWTKLTSQPWKCILACPRWTQ